MKLFPELVTTNDWGTWCYLQCPLCGCVTAGIEGTDRIPNPVREKEAPAHVLDGWCSEGHRWRLVFAWRKGETIVLVQERPLPALADPEYAEIPEEREDGDDQPLTWAS